MEIQANQIDIDNIYTSLTPEEIVRKRFRCLLFKMIKTSLDHLLDGKAPQAIPTQLRQLLQHELMDFMFYCLQDPQLIRGLFSASFILGWRCSELFKSAAWIKYWISWVGSGFYRWLFSKRFRNNQPAGISLWVRLSGLEIGLEVYFESQKSRLGLMQSHPEWAEGMALEVLNKEQDAKRRRFKIMESLTMNLNTKSGDTTTQPARVR